MTDLNPPADVPVVDWFDQAAMLADPYPSYARLRALGPVVHVPRINRYLLTYARLCDGGGAAPRPVQCALLEQHHGPRGRGTPDAAQG